MASRRGAALLVALRYRISVEAGLVLQGLCGFDPLPVPVPTVPA